MLIVNRRIAIPLSELHFTFSRSAGPGGQNVNKVSSKALLKWDLARSPHVPEEVRVRLQQRYASRITKEGVLVVQSQRFRDRNRNVADCLAKLQAWIAAAAIPPKRRWATKPTRSSQAARLRAKQAHAHKKQQRRRPPSAD